MDLWCLIILNCANVLLKEIKPRQFCVVGGGAATHNFNDLSCENFVVHILLYTLNANSLNHKGIFCTIFTWVFFSISESYHWLKP